jgi:hypothetical protein
MTEEDTSLAMKKVYDELGFIVVGSETPTSIGFVVPATYGT